MSFARAIEWEIRGLVLVSGRLTDSPLGVGFGRTESEAIAHWRQRRREWHDKASCIHAIPAPVFRVRPLLSAVTVCVLVGLASLAGFAEPTVGPSWASDARNTRGIHTPSPLASVGAGAISPAVGGNRTTLHAQRGRREETGYRVAVPACNWHGNDNRHSHALAGGVYSALEAPTTAQAGGKPAPIFGHRWHASHSGGSKLRDTAAAPCSVGENPTWPAISTPGAPRESLRTPHCPPVST